MRFACFIITFERPAILEKTIEQIHAQTQPPSKILIVDNSQSKEARMYNASLATGHIDYLATGDNIGPAGAAAIGLQTLAAEGFDWIYWCDDDDPPLFPDTLEILLGYAKANENIGVIGAVGHYFIGRQGLVKRVSDRQLNGTGLLEVDVIAGNMSIIVNALVVKQNVLPNPDLFLNIEEYDFCLRAIQKGFRVVTVKETMRACREHWGRIGKSDRPSRAVFVKNMVWRKYYSTRNLIYILRKNDRNFSGAINVSLRAIGKLFAGFSNGFGAGCKNAKAESLGLLHGWFGLMGRRMQPINKYKGTFDTHLAIQPNNTAE